MNVPAASEDVVPVVRLDRIWKSFGRLEVLTDVSLSVPRAEVVCIIGPSGAGKSTLLRCINHLETVDDGTIHFDGRPVYRYREGSRTVVDSDRRIEAIRAQIGMVFQAFNLFPHLTALGNVIEAPVYVLREPAAAAHSPLRPASGRRGQVRWGSAWPNRPACWTEVIEDLNAVLRLTLMALGKRGHPTSP